MNKQHVAPIEIDITEITCHMANHDFEIRFYLDKVTGKVELYAEEEITGEPPAMDPEDERYELIPTRQSSDGFRVMEEFATEVRNVTLRAALLNALSSRKPFRKFKDVLSNYPDQRQAWFDFNEARLQEQAVEWLDSLDIKYVLRNYQPLAAAVKDFSSPDNEPESLQISLDQVKEAVLSLAPDEFQQFAQWFRQYDAQHRFKR